MRVSPDSFANQPKACNARTHPGVGEAYEGGLSGPRLRGEGSVGRSASRQFGRGWLFWLSHRSAIVDSRDKTYVSPL
jgi:hypothetical protein